MSELFYERELTRLIRENETLKRLMKELSLSLNQSYELVNKFMSQTFREVEKFQCDSTCHSESVNFHHFAQLIDHYEVKLKQSDFSLTLSKNVSASLTPQKENEKQIFQISSNSQFAKVLKSVIDQQINSGKKYEEQISQLETLNEDQQEQIERLQNQINRLKGTLAEVEFELSATILSKQKSQRLMRKEVCEKQFVIRQLMQEVKSVNLTCSRVIQASQENSF